MRKDRSYYKVFQMLVYKHVPCMRIRGMSLGVLDFCHTRPCGSCKSIVDLCDRVHVLRVYHVLMIATSRSEALSTLVSKFENHQLQICSAENAQYLDQRKLFSLHNGSLHTV